MRWKPKALGVALAAVMIGVGCSKPSIPESALNRGESENTTNSGGTTQPAPTAPTPKITGNPSISLAETLEDKETITLTYKVNLNIEGGQLDASKPVDYNVTGGSVTKAEWIAPGEVRIILKRTGAGTLKVTRLNFLASTLNPNVPAISGVATWEAYKAAASATGTSTKTNSGSNARRRTKKRDPGSVPPLDSKAEKDFWKKYKM